MVIPIKRALVISTEVALSGRLSGAHLRVSDILNRLEGMGFKVTSVSRASAKNELEKSWDLIVVVSYSAARILRRARRKTECLWFDPTDSWRKARISMFKNGNLLQILLLMRDLFWILISPSIDILTFISDEDAFNEQTWWKRKSNALILPISNLNRDIVPSTKVRFVFVGDGSYFPNREAVGFLVRVLQLLDNSFVIHVFGKHFDFKHPRIIFHGYAPESELYRSRDIHLAPIKSGAGTKMKVALPLWNGLTVVATSEACMGFVQQKNLIVAETELDFANQMKRVRETNNFSNSHTPGSSIYSKDDSNKVDTILGKIITS